MMRSGWSDQVPKILTNPINPSSDIQFRLPAVIRSFLSYLNVMCMTFTHACVSNFYKGCLLQCGNIFCAAVPHPGPQPAGKLMYNFTQKTFVSNTALNTFRHIFFCFFRLLKVAVITALS